MSELSDELNSKAIKSCSLEQAFDLFDAIADRKDIAFGFPRDGCYARAHIMCQIAMDMGLNPLKSWAFEVKKGEPLTVECDDGGVVKWWYHVAMALAVTQEDDSIERMVFDPSLFDGPVSLNEWGDVMAAHKDKLEIIGYNDLPKGQEGNYNPVEVIDSTTDKKAFKTMKEFLSLQSKEQRVVFPSQSRQQQYTKQKQSQEAPHGKTWKTSEKQYSMMQHRMQNQTTDMSHIKKDFKHD